MNGQQQPDAGPPKSKRGEAGCILAYETQQKMMHTVEEPPCGRARKEQLAEALQHQVTISQEGLGMLLELASA